MLRRNEGLSVLSEIVALVCLTFLAAHGKADSGVAVAGLMATILGHATAAGWRGRQSSDGTPPTDPPATGIGAALLAIGWTLGRFKARTLGLAVATTALACAAGCARCPTVPDPFPWKTDTGNSSGHRE